MTVAAMRMLDAISSGRMYLVVIWRVEGDFSSSVLDDDVVIAVAALMLRVAMILMLILLTLLFLTLAESLLMMMTRGVSLHISNHPSRHILKPSSILFPSATFYLYLVLRPRFKLCL